MDRRQCITCEYHQSNESSLDAGTGKCFLELRQLKNGNWGFPIVYRGNFCSKWEPKWDDNPNIKEAWEQFKMAYILITAGEKK